MQSSFRVDIGGARPKLQYTRKEHTKSRDGCKPCKQRRIKCDEEKPACNKCHSRNVACVYESTVRSKAISRHHKLAPSTSPISKHLTPLAKASPPTPSADVYNLSLAVVRGQLGDVLVPGAASDALRNLQHFRNETALALGFGQSQVVLSYFVSQAVWQFPFLMHGVLAVANAHLKKLYNSDSTAVVGHRIAEAGHWQLALQSYQGELQRIKDQRRSTADKTDAVFATALLSVVFTFAADDDIPHDMFTASGEEKLMEMVFNPLLSMGGFQALIHFLPYMDISPAWEAHLKSADDEANSFSSDAAGIDDLPIAFVRLCGLTPASSPTASAYHKLLRALTPLLLLQPGTENLPKLFAYVGRVWSQARSMFAARDPIALLFLSWWLAQLRQLDLWWITTRARSQCKAIANYLYSLDKPELLPFLDYPATFGAASIDWIWHEVNADEPRSDMIPVEIQVLALP